MQTFFLSYIFSVDEMGLFDGMGLVVDVRLFQHEIPMNRDARENVPENSTS